MCYTIPGKVINVQDNIATVEYFGRHKKAINELAQLLPGDYVYAQGGYVIAKVSAQEAEQVLRTWQELFVSLQEIDAQLTRPVLQNKNTPLEKILDKAVRRVSLTGEEKLFLSGLTEPRDKELFYKTANFLRQKYHANACCVHGIIEISNGCGRNCNYCGISTHNKGLVRYRMTKTEIIEAVHEAVMVHGFKALVLQSGEGAGYSIDELGEIIREIKNQYAVLILISFGEIGKTGLKKLFDCGARGLLMRFETSNPGLYAWLHPGFSLASRLESLRDAFEMGYLIITGSLIGLPGQTRQDIINDIELGCDLQAEMLSFGPFLPHAQTPLAKSNAPQENDMCDVLALARVLAPAQTKILVTTAFETLSAQARYNGLLCGANSLMLNATPLAFRPLYSLYPRRAHEQESIAFQVDQAVSLLQSLGRVPMDLGIADRK